MPLAATYIQDLNPLGNRVLSTLLAALPVLTLFYLLVGRRWLASWAGAAGAGVAVLVAWLAYGMPLPMAGWALAHGAVFGLLPIGWTVFGAMLLYNLTVETGQFAIIRRSIGGLSGDTRVQAVLIGFCFGALMEGAAGSGSPVAICGAMLVGLGMPPFHAAVICLIANTSPVAYGGIGTPILTLGGTSGLPSDTLSVMAGHQLPLLSCLIPLYMVKVMCTWRQTLAIWPALAVGGGSFALAQYTLATMHSWHPDAPNLWPLTDVGGSIFSLVVLALFLKFVWRPRDEWKFPAQPANLGPLAPPTPSADPCVLEAQEQVANLDKEKRHLAERELPLTAGRIALAWSPFVLMSLCLVAAGVLRQAEKSGPVGMWGVQSYYEQPVPLLDGEVERAGKLQKVLSREMAGSVAGPLAGAATPELFGPKGVRLHDQESAAFKFTWMSSPGTPVVVATLLAAIMLRASPRVCWRVLRRTVIQMKIPIPTIACMLGLSYVTKYAGIDATLGVAFAETGQLYPFFAALLGWLGVFLTGTDAGSNALFGSLQRITADQVYQSGVITNLSAGQAQVLICTANSTGGVMGKMIDAQSICVATAGTNQIGREADIFKAVIWHSVFLACVVGALTALQAFVPPFTHMVPEP